MYTRQHSRYTSRVDEDSTKIPTTTTTTTMTRSMSAHRSTNNCVSVLSNTTSPIITKDDFISYIHLECQCQVPFHHLSTVLQMKVLDLNCNDKEITKCHADWKNGDIGVNVSDVHSMCEFLSKDVMDYLEGYYGVNASKSPSLVSSVAPSRDPVITEVPSMRLSSPPTISPTLLIMIPTDVPSTAPSSTGPVIIPSPQISAFRKATPNPKMEPDSIAIISVSFVIFAFGTFLATRRYYHQKKNDLQNKKDSEPRSVNNNQNLFIIPIESDLSFDEKPKSDTHQTPKAHYFHRDRQSITTPATQPPSPFDNHDDEELSISYLTDNYSPIISRVPTLPRSFFSSKKKLSQNAMNSLSSISSFFRKKNHDTCLSIKDDSSIRSCSVDSRSGLLLVPFSLGPDMRALGGTFAAATLPIQQGNVSMNSMDISEASLDDVSLDILEEAIEKGDWETVEAQASIMMRHNERVFESEANSHDASQVVDMNEHVNVGWEGAITARHSYCSASSQYTSNASSMGEDPSYIMTQSNDEDPSQSTLGEEDFLEGKSGPDMAAEWAISRQLSLLVGDLEAGQEKEDGEV